MHSLPKAFCRPLAVAMPIRTPVRLPGPLETAIFFISFFWILFFAKSADTFASRSSDLEIFAAPFQKSISEPFCKIEMLPPPIPVSMAKINFLLMYFVG